MPAIAPLPPLTAIPRDVVAVADYLPHARLRLDDNAWAYLSGGAADELTDRWNREAFDYQRLHSRVLTSLAGGHTRRDLFGQVFDHPILLAPVAYQRLFHPEGENASALAAAVTGSGLVLSTLSSTPLETIAKIQTGPTWFQLYLQGDRTFDLALLRRAEAAGYQAIVLTVDAPLTGLRNREQRAGFHLPPAVTAVHLAGFTPPRPPQLQPGQSALFDGLLAQAPGWADLEWLRQSTRLPLLVKGILHPADALRALELGADGIIVSNHGGRTLDTLPATLDALPAIATAVAGRCPLLLDGGIRRGSDVFKALALGASAVLLGRGYIHGLAAAGALGVAHVLRTLREELEAVMALTGCPTLDAIGPHCLFDAP
ncbi:MAG TPA: alpha-hydroxy acid oxidase [Rhodocyclaceae bacterium]|jgi:4-hydroxymandelate oxidase|nr:alpha-hydroxy acid oxidase [Rhodocyclaceae bacterium]